MTNQQPGMAFSEFFCSARLFSLSAFLLGGFSRKHGMPTVQLSFLSEGGELAQAGTPPSFFKPRMHRIEHNCDGSHCVPLGIRFAWKTGLGIFLISSTQHGRSLIQRHWVPACDLNYGLLCIWLARSTRWSEKQHGSWFAEFWRAHVLR